MSSISQFVSENTLSSRDASWWVSSSWTMEQLLALNREQMIQLWSSLPEVSLEELQGHFMGFAPNKGDPERQTRMRAFLNNEDSARGYWLGKAFRKTGENIGEGYNRCRFPGGEIRFIGRFSTEVGPSLVDDKPSLLLYYGSYHREARTFVDEIRKLDDYVYVGVGSKLDQRGNRNLDHFILLGPTDDWVGGASGELVPDFEKPVK